jgi:hypothetical protein
VITDAAPVYPAVLDERRAYGRSTSLRDWVNADFEV